MLIAGHPKRPPPGKTNTFGDFWDPLPLIVDINNPLYQHSQFQPGRHASAKILLEVSLITILALSSRGIIYVTGLTGGFSAFENNSSKSDSCCDLRTHLSSALRSVWRSWVPCLGLKPFFTQIYLRCKTKMTKETGFVPLLWEGMTRRDITRVSLAAWSEYLTRDLFGRQKSLSRFKSS